MGLELHRQFPWIDYVCSGESDNSFPALVKRLAAGEPPDGVAGVIHRSSGESRLAAPPDRIQDMDRLPDPDYGDYFNALAESSLAQRIRPALLIESARGCWWGAKSHCTFCGLNGSTMAFRAKSASRVYSELERQKARYGVGRFLAVDNIMSYQYFRDLIPMLKERNPGVSLFYEIKSNLKRYQVEMLREAAQFAKTQCHRNGKELRGKGSSPANRYRHLQRSQSGVRSSPQVLLIRSTRISLVRILCARPVARKLSDLRFGEHAAVFVFARAMS
jgi:ribosomal peptide maturation radical SAM protein 1